MHKFGPYKRDHYLIHLVISGAGEYHYNNKVYKIEKNQGFVIFPEDVTTYIADKDNPWHYTWVGFVGTDAKKLLNNSGITRENPTFSIEEDSQILNHFMSIYHQSKKMNFNEYAMLGYLYLFFADMLNNNLLCSNNSEVYFNKALNYIHNNFKNDIKITDISNMLYIHRSHLFRLFKNNINMSPREYITKYRLNLVQELLVYSEHNIADIAYHSGFSSASALCKSFIKEYKTSPLSYRKSQRNR